MEQEDLDKQELENSIIEEQVADDDRDPLDAINAIRLEEKKALLNKTSETEENTDIKPKQEKEEVTNSEQTENKEESDNLEKTEDNQEIDNEKNNDIDNNDSNSVNDNAIKKRKFKADGLEYEFTEQEMLDQFGTFFGKAVNFTSKTQKLAPYRKFISAAEEKGYTKDQLNMALDLLSGNKDAIKQLAKDQQLDLSELSYEESNAYKPSEYGKSDTELQIQEIEEEISSDPEYTITADVIDKQWDQKSREIIFNNPQVIKALHADVKSGVYSKVAPEAMKLQLLGGNSKSSLDYYLLAGQHYKDSIKANESKNKIDNLNNASKEAEAKFEKESSKAKKKVAATSTGSSTGDRQVVNYLDDEQYEEWIKKIDSSI